jgi:hypothetical protein
MLLKRESKRHDPETDSVDAGDASRERLGGARYQNGSQTAPALHAAAHESAVTVQQLGSN